MLLKQPLTFIQSSDWLLGAPPCGRVLGLSPELTRERCREIDQTAEKIAELVNRERADALLLAGNLWMAETISRKALENLWEVFASLDPKPVFIAPGPSERPGAGSFFDPVVLDALRIPDWPDNVIVFHGSNPAPLPFPGQELTVAGLSWDPEEAPRAPLIPSGPAILVGHAPGWTDGLPKGFLWSALGGWPNPRILKDKEGIPRGAYSGTAAGRSWGETGRRIAWKIVIDTDFKTPPVMEALPLEGRVVHDLELESQDGDVAEATAKVEELFRQAGVRSEDIVRVRYAMGVPGPDRDRIRKLAAAVSFRSGLENGRLPEADSRTVDGRFHLDLQTRFVSATDESARRLAQAALLIGRNALLNRPLLASDLEGL